jgi:hypothetical protein
MGVLPQVLKIIFEAQRKKIIKKLTQNKLSSMQNAFFFSFSFSLDPSYFQTS